MSVLPNLLGRLERVPLRQAWASEARDFTPWLATTENLQLLGEAVGMSLEVEAQEHSVGPFRADILCRNATDGSWVLIENQLERTDHSHLGQLLTYAAGLDAVAIIWIAERFTDEHRAALDWLNDKTPEGIGFFGLEVELWRIGNSALAPKFNVVCKPNAWTRTLEQGRRNPELSEMCRDYWAGVLTALAPSGILVAEAQPVRKQDIAFPVGWQSFILKAYFSRAENKLGVWVSCRGPRALANLATLRESQLDIEQAFGGPLNWESHEEQNRGTIIQAFDGYDPTNRSDWSRQHQFLVEKLAALYRAVAPIVARLDAADCEKTPA